MENPPRRHWDVAPLIATGVLLGLFGSLWQTPAGALSSLIGFTLLLTGLVRWSRRARRPVAASVDTPRATASL